ncbi:MAG: hypF [Firmicutes bacterium]|nr:hypF [Bacillota bacterium]
MPRRKLREDKPFAVMGGSLDILKRHCVVTKEEAQLLTGSVKPIVLVKKSAEYSLAEAVAPGNPYLGVMLPYAPVHYFLLRPEDILVMTSGNISDEPIVYEDDDAFDRLSTIADYFLVHNRRIYCRADDSVCRTFQEKPYWLRRGRGLAPAPIKLATSGPKILACGGELKNTFCLTADNMAFISAHTGDLENQATYNSYRDSIRHYQEMLNITPELVACDLHPGYLSTQYARELGLPVVGVQHHHAHIAAVLAEHGMDEKVIGVAFDGTGYGTDGNIWGGEFFLADCSDYIRLAHCAYLKLPGGARAIQEPWRLAAWQLYSLYGPDFINRAVPLTSRLQEGWQLVLQAAEKGINTPLSAGAGRLFDIAAAILGIRTHIHYEGQAAVELELAAAGIQGKALPYQIQGGTPLELDFSPAFEALVNRMEAGADYRSLAADFHATVAAAMIETVGRLGRMTGVNKVVLSGGVFQNVTLLSLVVTQLEKDFIVLLPKMVPPNDGGLSLGQIAVARKRSEGRCV